MVEREAGTEETENIRDQDWQNVELGRKRPKI